MTTLRSSSSVALMMRAIWLCFWLEKLLWASNHLTQSYNLWMYNRSPYTICLTKIGNIWNEFSVWAFVKIHCMTLWEENYLVYHELIIFRSRWCSVSHHYVCLNVLNIYVLSLGLWPAAVLNCLRYFWFCSILADEISCLPTWLSWLVMPTERGVCFPPYDYSVWWVMYMFITFWPKLNPSRWYFNNACITVYYLNGYCTSAQTQNCSRAWSESLSARRYVAIHRPITGRS